MLDRAVRPAHAGDRVPEAARSKAGARTVHRIRSSEAAVFASRAGGRSGRLATSEMKCKRSVRASRSAINANVFQEAPLIRMVLEADEIQASLLGQRDRTNDL
jgi:hypothetical protein